MNSYILPPLLTNWPPWKRWAAKVCRWPNWPTPASPSRMGFTSPQRHIDNLWLPINCRMAFTMR